MSKQSAREELARTLGAAYGSQDWMVTPTDRKAAETLVSAGYRIPKVLGYVVVDRNGGMVTGASYTNRQAAQAYADRWTDDAKANRVDWDYRVAEITEPTA